MMPAVIPIAMASGNDLFTQEQVDQAVTDAEAFKDAIIANFDVNGDGLIGLDEAIRALQIVSAQSTQP